MTWPWTFICEIGTSRGLFPDGWEDVSDRLVGESDISYGRDDEFDVDRAGTGSFWLDNRDGKWDPGIPPNTAVRLAVTVDGDTFPLWYGVVESAPALWPAYGNARARVQSVDALALLANSTVTMDMTRQKAGVRIGHILDGVGWPSGMRDLDDGVLYVEPLDTEAAEPDPEGETPSDKALTALQDTVEAEQGQMWIAPDGTFTFRDRHARLDRQPKLTLSADANEVVSELEPEYDNTRLYQYGRVEMSDGRVVEVGDEPGLMLGEELVVRDPLLSHVESVAMLHWGLYRYSTPSQRFASLEVEGRRDEALLKSLLTLVPGDLVRVTFTPEAGHPVDELVHVERISHREQAGSWRTLLDLSPYFGQGPWFRWDDPDYGWDSGAKWAP